MRARAICFGIVLTAAIAAVSPARAQGPDEARLAELRERWERMPPERRERLRERLEQFEKLPAEKKKELRQRLERLEKLPPEVRRKLRERKKQLAQLEADQVQELRSKHQQLVKFGERFRAELDPDARAEYDSLTEEQQRQRLQQEIVRRRAERIRELLERLPEDERARIAGLAERERDKAIREAARRLRREAVAAIVQELPPELRQRLRRAVEAGLIRPGQLPFNPERFERFAPEERVRRVRGWLDRLERRNGGDQPEQRPGADRPRRPGVRPGQRRRPGDDGGGSRR